MVLAVPKDHPWGHLKAVDIEDLHKAPFISREGGSGTLRSFRKLLAKKGRKPEQLLNVVMEFGSTEAIKERLIAALGVSTLSRTSLGREIRDGLLREIPIRGLRLQRDFYQVLHRHRALSPVSQAFLH